MRFRKLKKQSRQKQKNEKENHSKIKYGTILNRIKAFITDMFMIYAPILYLITYVVLGGKDEFQSSTLAPLSGVILYGLISAFLWSKFGQTPGYKAYNLKVVDAKTLEQISFFQAALRFVAFIVSATFVLGLFVGFYRKDRASLHDIVTKTLVIEVDE